MKKRYYSLIACVFFLLFFTSYAHPALYQWVDKEGQVHVTDYPYPNRPAEVETIDEPVQQPVIPPMQQPSPESAPISQRPSEKDSYIPEPPKESTPPPATTYQQPQPQMPAIPPAIPKSPPVPEEKREFPISGILIFIILLIMYFYASLCLFLIAKKLAVPSPVFAWIPLIQVWTFVVVAKGTGGHPCL